MGPTACNESSSEDSQGEDPRFMISGGYSQVWSHLHFEGGFEPTVFQRAVMASFGYIFKSGSSFHLGAGAVLGGTIEGGGQLFDFGNGFVVSLRGVKPLVEQDGGVPFVIFSLSLSFSMNHLDVGVPDNARWISTDLRLGCTAGYTLFNFWQLYLSPKVFGGPVFWEQGDEWIQGRDRYFFQAGLGSAFLLPFGITVFVDGSPLGEQSISAGAAVSF